MSPEKEMSKRQVRREQMKRRDQRQRLITIGLIVLGALLIVVPIVLQMLKPVAAVQAVDPGTHPEAILVAQGKFWRLRRFVIRRPADSKSDEPDTVGPLQEEPTMAAISFESLPSCGKSGCV